MLSSPLYASEQHLKTCTHCPHVGITCTLTCYYEVVKDKLTDLPKRSRSRLISQWPSLKHRHHWELGQLGLCHDVKMSSNNYL